MVELRHLPLDFLHPLQHIVEMIIFLILIKLNLDNVCWFHVLRHMTMRGGPNKSLSLANVCWLFDLRNEVVLIRGDWFLEPKLERVQAYKDHLCVYYNGLRPLNFSILCRSGVQHDM